MIVDSPFNYLKANTVLFAQKVCQSFEDMAGTHVAICNETIRESSFATSFNTVAFVNFSGSIQGTYLLAIDNDSALKIINQYKENMTPQAIRDLREEYGSFIKEVLNLSVGQAIEELEKSFCDLTFSPGIIVYGEIEFPPIRSASIEIEGREGRMLCGFAINLANMKIGDKLEGALMELKHKAAEIQESRRNIEAILALLPTGLAAIDEHGTILPGYSHSTTHIVGKPEHDNLAKQNLLDVLGVKQEIRPCWTNWLSLVFAKFDKIPFGDLAELNPLSEFTNQYGKTFKLDWLPVTAEDKTKLLKLLVVIEDITNQRQLEASMANINTQHQENLDLVSQIVNLQPDEVTDFIYDSSQLLSDAQKVVQSDKVDREFINELFRTFHTLKGSSGQFRFKSLQKFAHKVEDHLEAFRDETTPLSDSSIEEIKHSIEDAKGYISKIQSVRAKLGTKGEVLRKKTLRSPETVTASISAINALIAQIDGLLETAKSQNIDSHLLTDISDIRNTVAELKTITLSFFHASFNALIDNTCEKTGKIATLTIGHDTAIDITTMRKLHQCLIHLINNAIDHGIEFPEERVAAGKLEGGLLILSSKKIDSTIQITLQDDGNGVDIAAVRNKIINAYHIPTDQVDQMSNEELFSYLLKPGFSIKQTVSETSGRGVGMDFVNHTIGILGGSLTIKSKPGTGTRITITLPQ